MRRVLIALGFLAMAATFVLVVMGISRWFARPGHVLTIVKPIGGTIVGAGLRCGTKGSECSTTLDKDEAVELQAEPDANFVFSGFSGPCAPTGRIVMSEARTCGATFSPLASAKGGAEWPFTIIKPTGGTVIATVGILCGTLGDNCSVKVPDGERVVLRVESDVGRTFWAFTGDCADSGETLMTAPRTCGATFRATPPPSVNNVPPNPSSRAGSPTSTSPPSTLPLFPWPPPQYSAYSTIDRKWLVQGAPTTLATVAKRIEAAFDAAGYGERTYYRIPDGFALVSRIEQIRPDATPFDVPARWAVATPRVHQGFLDLIRALFNAPPGYYRVIVFTVTDIDFAASGRPPSWSEATTWASAGGVRLPADVGSQLYGEEYYTMALIYELERRANQEPIVKVPSNLPGQIHLEKAGLWRALAHP